MPSCARPGLARSKVPQIVASFITHIIAYGECSLLAKQLWVTSDIAARSVTVLRRGSNANRLLRWPRVKLHHCHVSTCVVDDVQKTCTANESRQHAALVF
jgi:hypothetical protein